MLTDTGQSQFRLSLWRTSSGAISALAGSASRILRCGTCPYPLGYGLRVAPSLRLAALRDSSKAPRPKLARLWTGCVVEPLDRITSDTLRAALLACRPNPCAIARKHSVRRLLAVTDMHGDLRNVRLAIREASPDLVVSCGDWGERVTRGEIEEALGGVPALTVYGNHDDIDLLAEMGLLLPPGEVREVGGLRFAGISGIWAKSHRERYYVTDEDVAEQAAKLAGKGVDVLLSHGCPVGIADTVPGGRHGGQRCFLEAFHTVRPRLYLCGHLHTAQHRGLKDGALVVNVGYTCRGDYWTFEITDTVSWRQHKL
ncbi:MAG: metallophosphoesterase family protein [Armatimonadota bacterium]